MPRTEAGERAIGAKDRPDHLSDASDQQVVAWAKQGHDAAFRELVRRYERPVFSLLYRMVRDRALAEDLAQETFIKVLNGIKSYRPEFKFSSWIFKIANNAAIDHLRRKSIDTLSLDGAPSAGRSTGPVSCCVTWRGIPTRKSPIPSICPWERSKPISIGPVMNCVVISMIAGSETVAETEP